MQAHDETSSDIYPSLSEKIKYKNLSNGSKWTLNLVCSALIVCISSLITGYNIASTNLPNQLLKNFYGRKYMNHYYMQRDYLIEQEIHKLSECCRNSTEFGVGKTRSYCNGSEPNYLANDSYADLREIAYRVQEGFVKVDQLNSLLWAITNSLFVIGGMAAAYTSRSVLSYFGRRKAILLNNLFAIIGSFLVLLAYYVNSPVCVMISRLFYGVQAGMSYELIPLYLSEISPVALKSAIEVFHPLFIAFGSLASQLIGFHEILGTRTTWHFLLGLPVVPAMIAIILQYCFLKETPKAHLMNGNENDAIVALRRLRCSSSISEEITQMKIEQSEPTGSDASITELFIHKEFRWPLIIGIILHMTQQLCGINVIFFYSEGIFRRADLDQQSIQFSVMTTSLVSILSIVIRVPLIDRLYHRFLLIFPMCFMVMNFLLLTLFLNFKSLSISLSYLSVVCIDFFILLYTIALDSIPGIYVTESFRRYGLRSARIVCATMNWCCYLLVASCFEYLVSCLGDYAFTVLAAVGLVSIGAIVIKLPENRCRKFDDVMSSFEESFSVGNAGISELKLKENFDTV